MNKKCSFAASATLLGILFFCYFANAATLSCSAEVERLLKIKASLVDAENPDIYRSVAQSRAIAQNILECKIEQRRPTARRVRGDLLRSTYACEQSQRSIDIIYSASTGLLAAYKFSEKTSPLYRCFYQLPIDPTVNH